jgi:hypothetical protein
MIEVRRVAEGAPWISRWSSVKEVVRPVTT